MFMLDFFLQGTVFEKRIQIHKVTKGSIRSLTLTAFTLKLICMDFWHMYIIHFICFFSNNMLFIVFSICLSEPLTYKLLFFLYSTPRIQFVAGPSAPDTTLSDL